MTDKVETIDAVEILSGNEAIARGAWEAGVTLAASAASNACQLSGRVSGRL